eukprot:gene15411-20793_t
MALAKRRVGKKRQDYLEHIQHLKELDELEQLIKNMHIDWMQDLLAIRAQSGVRALLAK